MDQIERIKEMEACLDVSEEAIRKLSEALASFKDIQPQYLKLCNYYSSDQWVEDYEDDENGRLPTDLKRGVLSQDTIYDLITENRDLLVQMLRIAASALESEGI